MMQMFGDIFVVKPDAGVEDARSQGRYCGDRGEGGRWNDTCLHQYGDISAGLQRCGSLNKALEMSRDTLKYQTPIMLQFCI